MTHQILSYIMTTEITSCKISGDPLHVTLLYDNFTAISNFYLNDLIIDHL